MSPSPERPPLRRLLAYARPHRRRIVAATAYSILNRVFDLAPPGLIGLAVDVVVKREDSFLARLGVADPWQQLLVLAGLTVVIWGLESLFEYLLELEWRNLAQTLQHELRLDAYGRVQEMELGFFEDRSTGGLLAVLSDDVNQLERFLDVGANQILQTATSVLVIGAAFFWLAPQVAWMSMLPMPFVLWGSLAYQKRLAPRYAAVRAEVGSLNGDLAGNLGGMATIQGFVAEAREARRIAQRSEAYRGANRSAIRLSSAFTPLIRILILVGFTGTLLGGGWMTLHGTLAVGAYSVMVFFTQRLLWPLTTLGQTFDLYQRAMASTARVLDLVDLRPAIGDGARALPRAQAVGAMRLERVEFAYRSGAPVLRGVELDVPAGRTIAIVGATGAGKSTVVKLLLRFCDPTAGRVTLDGVDLRELRLADLRGALGLVSQDVFLFHGSVRENVAYGRPEASDEEVQAALQVAEADAFVAALPFGVDTVVGERGQKLSGGQRQRLSIARAVLKDPAVLILDEATSSVDNETEAAIQRSLARISVGRTVVVIAHRLSTVRHADAIHVLEAGRITESGTHEELVARGGAYAALWRVQTGEAPGAGERP